jgi:hypothetical protein
MQLPETKFKLEDIIEYQIRTEKGNISALKILNPDSNK